MVSAQRFGTVLDRRAPLLTAATDAHVALDRRRADEAGRTNPLVVLERRPS